MKEILKYDVRFIFEWRKLLFWEKYMWQWSLYSSIFQPSQFEHEHKKTCDTESSGEEAERFHASVTDLLLIRIGSVS